jgi:glutamyl-tRNA reductase
LKAEEKAEEKSRKELVPSAKSTEGTTTSVMDVDKLLSQLAGALR